MNYNDLPILEADLLRLRPTTESDIDLIVRWRNKDSVRKNFFYRGDFTTETHRSWLREKVFMGEIVQYIIEVESDGSFVPAGSDYLRDIDTVNGSAEFGIFIGKDTARCNGIGAKTAELFLDFVHNQLQLHRVFLRLVTINTAAYKLYRKVEFVTEGIFRDMKMLDGRYTDIMSTSSIQNSGKGGNSIVIPCRRFFYEVAA